VYKSKNKNKNKKGDKKMYIKRVNVKIETIYLCKTDLNKLDEQIETHKSCETILKLLGKINNIKGK